MCLTGSVFCASALGYETDPYTKRHLDIADSLAVLDREVNAALDEIAASWKHGENERRFINAMHRKLGGRWPIDRLEGWAMRSEEVARLPVTRCESLYGQLPMRATRVARFFGFGPNIKVNGVLIGTDKIGHFFSQGRKFYRRYLRSGDEDRAARRGVVTERFLFGRLMTGTFSNADLVANYEGYRFHRGLFQDGVVQGRPALIAWRDGRPERTRDFTWADHVNDFWDEALNPNAYSRTMGRHMARWLLRHCDAYRAYPERFAVADADALFERYRHIGLDRYAGVATGGVLSAALWVCGGGGWGWCDGAGGGGGGSVGGGHFRIELVQVPSVSGGLRLPELQIDPSWRATLDLRTVSRPRRGSLWPNRSPYRSTRTLRLPIVPRRLASGAN